jgi:hypothetical protein
MLFLIIKIFRIHGLGFRHIFVTFYLHKSYILRVFIVLECWLLTVNRHSVIKKYSALIDPAIAVVEAD